MDFCEGSKIRFWNLKSDDWNGSGRLLAGSGTIAPRSIRVR
jgi:hypothetical protein